MKTKDSDPVIGRLEKIRQQLDRTKDLAEPEKFLLIGELDACGKELEIMGEELRIMRHLASFPQINPNPVFEIAASGQIMFANEACRLLLESLGTDGSQTGKILPEDIAAILDSLKQGKSGALSREVGVADKVFEWTIYLMPESGTARIYGHDITKRKTAEEALRRSNAFNQSIIDSSSDCIKILDMDGRLQYMSPGGWRLLKINDMKIYLNVPYEEFWKGSDREAVIEIMQKAKQGQSGSFQGFCPTADGTPKWWDVSISPVLGPDGKPERLLAVSRDITERKLAEDEIRMRVGELRLANEELVRFNNAAVDREHRMIELKKEINELCGNAGLPARYKTDFEE